MINRVVLVGRITRDPELRLTTNGIENVLFTIAVNRQFSGQSGERQADFISCVAWRQSAKFLANYIKKGALIGVEGRIQTRQYEQDGITRYVTEVVVDSVQSLESRADSENRTQPTRSTTNNVDSDDYYHTSSQLTSDDDLPF